MQKEIMLDFIWYLFEGGFWAIVSMLWYKFTLFRCWGDMTYTESQNILWGIVIMMVFLGAWITCCSMDEWNILKTLLIAYGTYTVFVYRDIFAVRINVIFGSCAIVTVLGVMLIMFRKIRSKRKKRRIIMKRLYKCIYLYLSIVATGMGVLLLSIVCPLIIGNSFLQSSVKLTDTNTLQEQTIANNMEMLLLLQDEKWSELNVQDKLDVMQTVANIESHYLGLPNELNVSVINFQENKLGSYVDRIHTIYISLPHLETASAREVLDTCCHEAFHAYQHRLIDAYNSTDEKVKNLRIYNKTVVYLEEFDNYIFGEQDFHGYYGQLCETDARNYAKDAVKDYYDKIYKYLGISQLSSHTY